MLDMCTSFALPCGKILVNPSILLDLTDYFEKRKKVKGRGGQISE
jgi:hypothetical protein